jgi:hypothetical protein
MRTTGVLLRPRDLLVLLLVAVGLYVSLDGNEYTYHIEPAWFVDLRDSLAKQDWRLPPPLIVDLDGNQHKEIGTT